jgi:hypothetical protein
MSKFLTELRAPLKNGSETVYVLEESLIYQSDLAGRVEVPTGFETDLASVPRLPLVYWAFGGRAHREAVIHDCLYLIDSNPGVDCSIANKVFLEAMKARGKPFYVYYPMYLGVKLGGFASYHKRYVGDKL